jgi:phosphotransferase family enzyme
VVLPDRYFPRQPAAIGAAELPVTVIHGDFAEQNVHYRHGRLAGVIDFGLTRQDSRPYCPGRTGVSPARFPEVVLSLIPARR